AVTVHVTQGDALGCGFDGIAYCRLKSAVAIAEQNGNGIRGGDRDGQIQFVIPIEIAHGYPHRSRTLDVVSNRRQKAALAIAQQNADIAKLVDGVIDDNNVGSSVAVEIA